MAFPNPDHQQAAEEREFGRMAKHPGTALEGPVQRNLDVFQKGSASPHYSGHPDAQPDAINNLHGTPHTGARIEAESRTERTMARSLDCARLFILKAKLDLLVHS